MIKKVIRKISSLYNNSFYVNVQKRLPMEKIGGGNMDSSNLYMNYFFSAINKEGNGERWGGGI